MFTDIWVTYLMMEWQMWLKMFLWSFPHRIQQLDCLYHLLFLCTSIYNPFQEILHQDRFYLGNELQYLIVFGLYAASSVCVIAELMWFFA